MSETEHDCAANYREPPLHTRFKKGQSGNPRGRPKKTLPALLLAALNEPVTVTEGRKTGRSPSERRPEGPAVYTRSRR